MSQGSSLNTPIPAPLTWDNFLATVRAEYELKYSEWEVVSCLQEAPGQTRIDLLKELRKKCPDINQQAFAARLTKVFRRFSLLGREKDKIPLLHEKLRVKYLAQRDSTHDQYKYGLLGIHKSFPLHRFVAELENVRSSDNPSVRKVDIMQTFAPNLESFLPELVRCLEKEVTVRILLAWPYSRVANLREQVLEEAGKTYSDTPLNVKDSVMRNLETLNRIPEPSSKFIRVRLYDALPTMAVYRAGNVLYASPFLYGSLAVDTFQLELSLNDPAAFMSHQITNDFESMWNAGKDFPTQQDEYYHSELKILFAEQSHD